MSHLRIGELADRTGTSAPTIRYYEEIGLLRAAPRQSGNQRVYGPLDVNRLTFIRRCREFDFSIEQVRTLVGLLDNRSSSCLDARELAAAHLEPVAHFPTGRGNLAQGGWRNASLGLVRPAIPVMSDEEWGFVAAF